jgi:hypothetical protein
MGFSWAVMAKPGGLMRCVITSFLLLCMSGAAWAQLDDCVEIDSIPFTISAPGVYCLKKDLNGNLASGSAIRVESNSVTIDLNGFKLGNLAAGPDTTAFGILASGRANVTIRNGSIRGFYVGIRLLGTAGGNHLIENLELLGTTHMGLGISSPGTLMRNNRIIATGGGSGTEDHYGIWLSAQGAQARGNEIAGMTATGEFKVYGIRAVGDEIQLIDNVIRGLKGVPDVIVPVFYSGDGAILEGNRIISVNPDNSAIVVNGFSTALCRDNLAVGYERATFQCADGGDNIATQ